MVTREETLVIMQRIYDSRPTKFFKPLDETHAGINCMMKTLAKENSPLTAGQISEKMGVSTARVAVLLKKMSEKGIIVREGTPEDARKSLISLSDEGRRQAEQVKEELISIFQGVIERIGMEKAEQFIEISNAIKSAVEEEFDSREKLNEGGIL